MPAGTCFLYREGMFGDVIGVEKDRYAEDDNIYYIEMKNHILHAAHPLAWLRELNVNVDGEAISSCNMYFVLRDQWICVQQMPTIKEIFWTINETARLYFRTACRIEPGVHEVRIKFVASSLEGTRHLDLDNKWPGRCEKVELKMRLSEEVE